MYSIAVFQLSSLPQCILLQILAKMKWSELSRSLKTNKALYQFIKENWTQLKKCVRLNSLHARYNNVYTRVPLSRSYPEPLDLSDEWLKGIQVDGLYAEDIEWNSRLVERIVEIFTFFKFKWVFFHFPKLPYTANLLGKIRPEGIVLNVNWNVKYWKEALPALQSATTVNMSNGRCYDLSFLTETHQEVNIRPDGRAISELRTCITNWYQGKTKPCPLIHGETIIALRIEDLCDRNVLYKWHSFSLHGMTQHLYVINLPGDQVLAIALYRKYFTLKLFPTAGHAKRDFDLFGYQLRR